MIFVAIGTHSPAQCPGHVKSLFDELSKTMPKIPEVSKKNQVEVKGVYSILAAHKMVAIFDAPDPNAVEMTLYELGLLGWSTFEIAPGHDPQDAMKMAAEKFGKK